MLWAYNDSSPSLANELPSQTGVSPGQASSQHPGLGEPGVGPPLACLLTARPSALPAAAGANCCLSLINLDLSLLSALRHHSSLCLPREERFRLPKPPLQRSGGSFQQLDPPKSPTPLGSTELACMLLLWPGTSWSFRMSPDSLPGSGPLCDISADVGRSAAGGLEERGPENPGWATMMVKCFFFF